MGNERLGHGMTDRGRAISALVATWRAQNEFRQSDRDGDGVRDFGTVSELRDAGWSERLDRPCLYDLRVQVSRAAPGSCWMAIARPRIEGEHWLVVNQFGRIHESSRPIALRDDCEIQPECAPVGK